MTPAKRRVNKQYSAHTLRQALDGVKKKQLSIRSASELYGIPYSTLLAKYQGKYALETRPGPPTVLTSKEELILVEWVCQLSATGFHIDKDQFCNSVQKLVTDLKKKNPMRIFPFTNNRPSKHWYKSFINRHPELSKRMTQNLSLRKAKVTEEAIRYWFQGIKAYLESKNLLGVNSSRIFNCDESAFLLNPKPTKVLVTKGQKAACKKIKGDEKESVSVLVTGNAAGQVLPSMVLYPCKRIPPDVVTAAPKDWILGLSKNGWMTQEAFYEYITGCVYPWCVKNKIVFPIILFVDAHPFHFNLSLSEFCVEKKIELMALYPNSTHLIQPMDVAYFRPLKAQWNKVVSNWRMENNAAAVTKANFASLLEKAISDLDSKKILKNGFKASGLHPFDPNAVDYLRFFKCSVAKLDVSQESTFEKENLSHLEFIENHLDSTTLQLFKQCKATEIWTGELQKEDLFKLWLSIASMVEGEEQRNLLEQQNQEDPLFFEVSDEGLRESCEFEQQLHCNEESVLQENIDLSSNVQLDKVVLENSIPDTVRETIYVLNNDGTLSEESIDYNRICQIHV